MPARSAAIGILLALVLAGAAQAAALPRPLCGNLPGCGRGPANVIADAAIPEAARILLNLAAGLSLIFVLVGGARYILGFGREEQHTKAFWTIFWALAGLVVALLSYRIVKLIITERLIPPGSQDPLFALLVSAVRIITALLNVTFLTIVVIGGMRMVYARGAEEEVTKGRHMVAYAIIGTIIINIAPVIVRAFLHL